MNVDLLLIILLFKEEKCAAPDVFFFFLNFSLPKAYQVKFGIKSGFSWNNNLLLQRPRAWQTQEGKPVFLTPRVVILRRNFQRRKKWHWSLLIFRCEIRETSNKCKSYLLAVVEKGVDWGHCLSLCQQLLVRFNPTSEECHRISRHLPQLPLEWSSSWFSLMDSVWTPSWLNWKRALFSWRSALSTISLAFLFSPQEMVGSLVFFCSATKIRKHEISGRAEILKDRLNNAFLIRFSQKSIAICCATETVCAVVTPGLWVCATTEMRAW